eukprot:COSAG02_NODE_23_length_52893_cov_58.101868_48_plen_608_part_00
MEERAPMMAQEDGQALLPGQPSQDVREETVGGQTAAIVHVQSEPDQMARVSEPRGPTPTEESVTIEPDPVAVGPPKESDGWDGWQDGDLCAVCQAECSDTPLKCGHALHPQCLAEWTLSNAEQRGNCPTCRQPLASRPRSPPDRDMATTPRIPTPPSRFDLAEDGQAPDPVAEVIATESRIDWRDVARYLVRLAALAALVTISGLAIFTCSFSGDVCCAVECEGGRVARYRYSNSTCVCAAALDTGWPQPLPKCEHWRYPGQRLVRTADSDARCAASSLSNRLIQPDGALLGSKRYLLVTSIGATCAAIGLQSVNSTLECEIVLRAANNDYAVDAGLGHKTLTQVRRGLAENAYRYLYHVERREMFNRADAAPGTRRTGWYRKRTPSYSATDCGAATFIEASAADSLFRVDPHEGDIRANPDNPRYAPQVEWTGFDGPHPVDRGVGLPMDISTGWEFVPPILDTDQAAEQPYAQALEAATLQNEAFAQGYVAAIFCVAPDDLRDAAVGGICAQEPLSYLDIFYWFLLLPMLVVGAGVLKRLQKNQFVGRVLLVLVYWLLYLWITAAQCSQGKTAMMNAEIGLTALLIVCATCVCMCRMPCCSNERLQ